MPPEAAADTPGPMMLLNADTPFHTLPELIRAHARAEPARPALADDRGTMDYATLDARMDRIAAALQRDGLRPGAVVAIAAQATVEAAAVFLGALRAGLAVAPLSTSVTPAQWAAMRRDSGAGLVFVDAAAAALLHGGDGGEVPHDGPAPAVIAFDDTPADRRFADWLAPPGAVPQAVTIAPEDPFNLIYSSGTTGTPKGIVQPHGMRWAHVLRGAAYGYGPRTVTLLATPLYSNTTLVVFVPTLAWGGCVRLMARFDARRYLELAQAHGVTHTMLVPVQYRRLLALSDFDRFDLGRFQAKFCTSAPFPAELKAEVLRRWPGGLVEFYGLTEGGGTCILDAHRHPDKLHTVGRPTATSDVRLIDENGRELTAAEVAAGAAGEVVGASPGMMTGYHGQPEKTREAEWFDASGKRFIRTGDIGRFDADGFLILFDRRKDMVISGGFNIYPSDLEAELRRHPAVDDVAVFGVPSAEWGETPVACVVRRAGHAEDAETLRAWLNARVGKTQRLSALHLVDELPRNAIGKVLKRELRARFG